MRTLILISILTTYLSAASTFDQLLDPVQKDTVRTYNPFVTTSLSIIPGGGQFYTRHFTKGALFLGTEAIFASRMYVYRESYHNEFHNVSIAEAYYDSVTTAISLKPDTTLLKKDTSDLISAYNFRNQSYYNREEKRIEMINNAGWFTTIFAWNLVDALGLSNRFSGAQNPTPKRAALLSAIPFTGAGQFYNGNFFKGAMVSIVEISCMATAINFQRLMNDAEKYGDELSASLPDSGTYKQDFNSDQNDWKGKYDNAATRRTRFMWYGIFFYLYGVADAAVDAHLHNFESHFDIAGGFDPIREEMSIAFTGSFGKRKKSF